MAKKKQNNKVLKSIIKKVIPILKRNGVVKAGIFGSYARGDFKKKSDIDILVKPPKGMGFEFFGMGLEIEEELKRKVDLVTYNSLHPLLKKRILEEEIRIL